MIAVSNSSSSTKLKFDDVAGLILSEESRRKALGVSGDSGNALNVEGRGRSLNKGGNKHGRSKSRKKSKGSKDKDKCWHCGKKGHMKHDCITLKKQEKSSQGRKDSVNLSEESDTEALILSPDARNKSWVIYSGASFHAASCKEVLRNYVSGDFRKVYLGDDEPCSIVGKGDVHINQKHETTLKLKDVRHVPSLKRNLISVGQLADTGYVTTFISDSWKITKGTLVISRYKKEGTLYVTSGSYSSLAVASIGVNWQLWHQRLGHISEKGMKVLLSKRKLPALQEKGFLATKLLATKFNFVAKSDF